MDEIILESRIPLLVDPAGSTYTAYNNMLGNDPLFVSSHGDIEKKWLRVEQGDYVKFASSIFMLQNTSGQVILPVYETAAAVVPPAVP